MRTPRPILFHTFLVAVAAGLVATACSDDGGSSAATSTAAPTTAVPTTAVRTTAVPTSAPTTVGEGPTTTAVPPPPAAGEVIVGGGLLLGWWDGAAWQRTTDDEGTPSEGLPLRFGAPYTFVSIDGRRVEASLGAGTSECIEPDVPVYVEVPAEVRDMLGVAAGVDLLPRPVEEIGAAAEHEGAVQEWLEGEGLSQPQVAIDRVTRVDLDGDGVFEVLVEASRITDTSLIHSPAGDYSVVLLRHVVDDEAVTALVRGDVVTVQEAAGQPGGFLTTAELLAVADVDGDGRFEVAVEAAYYEGSGVTISSWSDGRLQEVLANGCGV